MSHDDLEGALGSQSAIGHIASTTPCLPLCPNKRDRAQENAEKYQETEQGNVERHLTRNCYEDFEMKAEQAESWQGYRKKAAQIVFFEGYFAD